MFGFIKRLLGLEAPKPVKVFPVAEVAKPVAKVEAVTPVTTETKPKKKTTAKISNGTRKPRKKKD